jgi:cob(I)alamin adenosyltransferase
VNLLIREEDHENLIIQYMNRLSDYLFILGRYVAKKLDVEETSWDPRV